MRKIIHIDMDAFYASVEQRDNPCLLGKPIVVGADVAHGVVSTASYEARRFGIHSAMPISQAKRRCKDLIIIPPRFEQYKDVSRQIHEIFREYTDMIEPLSLDEAFLDVTSNKKGMDKAVAIAREIKSRIFEKTRLTASAGISHNKFLAKIASDWRKPDGMFLIHPDDTADFISALPVEKFWGVGAKTAQRMHAMGIFNGGQLRRVSRSHLVDIFGKAGNIYYDFARGIDERPVEAERERKSVGCEHTFLEDISERANILIELYHIVLELVERIAESKFEGKTLTLKIKYSDMTQHTRSVTGASSLHTKEDILPAAKQLLGRISVRHSIRLMGLAVSNPPKEDTPQSRGKSWSEGELDFQSP